jgi:hypothetical protein
MFFLIYLARKILHGVRSLSLKHLLDSAFGSEENFTEILTGIVRFLVLPRVIWVLLYWNCSVVEAASSHN